MTQEEELKVAAMLASQRWLIRELLVMTFASKPDAMARFDVYAKSVEGQFAGATIPQLGAAYSDMLSGEMSEQVQSILQEARATLTKVLAGRKGP